MSVPYSTVRPDGTVRIVLSHAAGGSRSRGQGPPLVRHGARYHRTEAARGDLCRRKQSADESWSSSRATASWCWTKMAGCSRRTSVLARCWDTPRTKSAGCTSGIGTFNGHAKNCFSCLASRRMSLALTSRPAIAAKDGTLLDVEISGNGAPLHRTQAGSSASVVIFLGESRPRRTSAT